MNSSATIDGSALASARVLVIGIAMDRQLIPHAAQPDDIASMVIALMSNPAVTAAVVDVDGGERLGTIS